MTTTFAALIQKSTALMIAISAAGVVPASHAGTNSSGVASEFTQYANFGMLTGQLVQQIKMVSETVQSRILQAQQYDTMVKNLQQITAGDLLKALAPFEMAQYQELLGSVKSLQASAGLVKGVIDRRGFEYTRSGFNDPAKYLAYERALSDQRGGIYKERLDQDIAAIDGMRAKHDEFKRVMHRTSAVTGNVEGLQHLAQVSSMATGELMQIKSAMLSENVEANLQRVAEQKNSAFRANLYNQSIKSAKDRAGKEPGRIDIDPSGSWGSMVGR